VRRSGAWSSGRPDRPGVSAVDQQSICLVKAALRFGKVWGCCMGAERQPRTIHTPWGSLTPAVHLAPLIYVLVLYGLVYFLPFGVFGSLDHR